MQNCRGFLEERNRLAYLTPESRSHPGAHLLRSGGAAVRRCAHSSFFRSKNGPSFRVMVQFKSSYKIPSLMVNSGSDCVSFRHVTALIGSLQSAHNLLESDFELVDAPTSFPVVSNCSCSPCFTIWTNRLGKYSTLDRSTTNLIAVPSNATEPLF